MHDAGSFIIHMLFLLCHMIAMTMFSSRRELDCGSLFSCNVNHLEMNVTNPYEYEMYDTCYVNLIHVSSNVRDSDFLTYVFLSVINIS